MLAAEALAVCENMMFAHVSTLIDKNGEDHIIESSIMKVNRIYQAQSAEVAKSEADKAPNASPQWKVETRNQQEQKVSLHLYREESKKIFAIINRFAKNIEKAGTDEAFLDVTEEVNMKYDSEIDY